jgi:hypothetical protein
MAGSPASGHLFLAADGSLYSSEKDTMAPGAVLTALCLVLILYSNRHSLVAPERRNQT